MTKKVVNTKQKEPEETLVKKQTFTKKRFKLKVDLIIGEQKHEKGSNIDLTEKQENYFKLKNYI